MFHNIQANYRVERDVLRKRTFFHSINVGGLKIRTGWAKPIQSFQIKRIHISGPINRARYKVNRHVAGTRSDFQDAVTHKRPDNISHPSSESRRASEAHENLAAMSVSRVDLIRSRVVQDGPQCMDAILPIDLLSFGIGAAGIADGDFEDATAAFGQFNGEFRLR